MWISVWKLLTTSPLFIISLLNKNLFPTPIFRMISKEEKKTRGTNLASAYLRAVWRDWAIYWTLGNFSKPKATINLPKSSTFLGDFWGLKSLIFLVKSFWATFIDTWRFFSGHTGKWALLRRYCEIFYYLYKRAFLIGRCGLLAFLVVKLRHNVNPNQLHNLSELRHTKFNWFLKNDKAGIKIAVKGSLGQRQPWSSS